MKQPTPEASPRTPRKLQNRLSNANTKLISDLLTAKKCNYVV